MLIESADRVLTGRDPSGVSFEEIADAAGVSRALVYNYFGDRHGLMVEVQRHRISRLLDSLTSDTDDVDPELRLRAMVSAHVRAALVSPATYAEATRELSEDIEVRDVKRVLVTGLVGALPGGEPVTDAVVAAVCSATRRWAGEASEDSLVDDLTRLLWNGLASFR
jgi:AcrR family transcriptional regulator